MQTINKTLQICETFKSIQGESSFVGIPCFFIRLTKCNLRCKWCDTKYAITEEGRELTIDNLIQQANDSKVNLICITGGEPLLQKNCKLLINALTKQKKTVIVETNGSIDISMVEPPAIRIMDIKSPSSGEVEKFRIENIELLRLSDQVKFVIGNQNDYTWCKELIKKHNLTQKAKILMGAVEGCLDLKKLSEWILADNLEVRLQVQLHKIIWQNNERGV